MTPPHTPESLLALKESPEGLEQMRIIAAEADGYFECPCGVQSCVFRHDQDGSFFRPNYPASLDAIFSAEERLGLHGDTSDAFILELVRHWQDCLEDLLLDINGYLPAPWEYAFLPPPLRLIPFILTAQWKEQNKQF